MAKFNNQFRAFSLFALLPLTVLSFSSCKGVDDAPTPKSGSSVGSVAPPLASPGGTGVFLLVESAFENQNNFSLLKSCNVPFGTTPGSPAATMACNLAVPEGNLYYSKLRFTIGTDDASTCAFVSFQPYYYQASSSAGFLPNWSQTPIDCSANPISADCFSGAALQIAPSFPTYRGTYILPTVESSHAYTIDSGNVKQRGSNRWTVNDLPIGKQAANRTPPGPGSDNYLANSYHDYVVTCRDPYYEAIYTITLYLTDINGPTEQIFTWLGTL